MLCEYGCGQEALYQFKNGKWCCSKFFSQCPIIIEKQNNSRLYKIEENKKNEMCKFGCGSIGKYLNKNRDWCCNDHHTKCSSYKIYMKNNNPMSDRIIKERHANEMKKLSGKNNPLYTCKGALERHLKSQRSKETRIKKSISTLKAIKEGRHFSKPYSLKEYKKRYSLLVIVENLIEDEDGNILAHCKNNNCKNSLEQGGRFKPNSYQLQARGQFLKTNKDQSYLYCSNECKTSCTLFGKSTIQLIKEDQINAGIIEDPWYTSSEYLSWRQHIFNLDDNKCVYCENPAEHAHHILPQKIYPNLSLDPDNGIACCKECHYKYGHRDPWCTIGYLSQLVCERVNRIKSKTEKG